MRFIALEEHFLPKDIAEDAGIDPASVWGLLDALATSTGPGRG